MAAAGAGAAAGVLADLAERLAARARAGESAQLTGPGGLLTGLIGQVLQAGLAAELGAHLEAGEGGPAERVERRDAEHRGGAGAAGGPADRDGTFEPLLVPAGPPVRRP